MRPITLIMQPLLHTNIPQNNALDDDGDDEDKGGSFFLLFVFLILG